MTKKHVADVLDEEIERYIVNHGVYPTAIIANSSTGDLIFAEFKRQYGDNPVREGYLDNRYKGIPVTIDNNEPFFKLL